MLCLGSQQDCHLHFLLACSTIKTVYASPSIHIPLQPHQLGLCRKSLHRRQYEGALLQRVENGRRVYKI